MYIAFYILNKLESITIFQILNKCFFYILKKFKNICNSIINKKSQKYLINII